jgi:hypothetical protein
MNLNIKQRFFAAGIYIAIILLLGSYFSGDVSTIFDPTNKYNALFIVTALSLVLGSYIIEPFFSKPVEVVARWVAIVLFLLTIENKAEFRLYDYWIWVSMVFIGLALVLIFFHDSKKLVKERKVATDIICKISRPEIVFSVLYFFIILSFFTENIPDFEYALLIGFGFLLLVNKPVNWFTRWVWRLFNFLISSKEAGDELGQIIGHDSIDFYKVEITGDTLKGLNSLTGELVYLESDQKGIIGIVVDEKYLVGRRWIHVFSLRGEKNNLITFDLNSFEPLAGQKTVYSKTHSIKHITKDDLEEGVRKKVEINPVYKNFKKFVGYVWRGSTIKQIKFLSLFNSESLKEENIGEGTILETSIRGNDVLYQIIDGRTEEEGLEQKDSHGYIIGTAQKLGQYKTDKNELETIKWLPEIYTPVFILEPQEAEYEAEKFIGKLPNTNYGFPIKEPDTLVTHNTAILGILGIGKSCLTFELIQKLEEATDVKIICIDLTNQYEDSLKKYIGEEKIQTGLKKDNIKKLKDFEGENNPSNPESWGNEKLYRQVLKEEFIEFDNSDRRILILNPDWHPVEKAGAKFKISYKTDLTAAEKTRIISERLFLLARSKGESTEAKYLIVFEEAHSLVPEWNSVANEGDTAATNGTAKVILQGRKYGLGTMVVTQRTANISKSILNQCNTIFALRVFDDTGKQFLENYIGSDYSNVLPTLEERHAVVTGKALKLKQPVIMELNDRKLVADYNLENEEDEDA